MGVKIKVGNTVHDSSMRKRTGLIKSRRLQYDANETVHLSTKERYVQGVDNLAVL